MSDDRGVGTAPEHRLVTRARGLLRSPQRLLIGVAGTPGAGKTTFAQWFTAALCEAGVSAANVPMDGFHLADAELARRGRLDRKGAADTFDGDGYLALLRRLRDERDHTVFAPEFDRAIEQPIAGAIAVEPDVDVVVTEGNYLLADVAPWPDVYDAVDEVWFCDVDAAERRSRLIARHVRFGKTPEQAHAWVDTVDEVNAQGVEPGRARAALVLFPHEWPPPAAADPPTP